jgi:MFS superfamily sulfate permease-like transporter
MNIAARQASATPIRRFDSLEWAGRTLRSFVRASAVAGFAVGLGSFALYAKPWGSQWDPWKLGITYAMGLAALTGLLSLFAGFLALTLAANTRARRPIGWYAVLDLLTLVLGVLTPSI